MGPSKGRLSILLGIIILVGGLYTVYFLKDNGTLRSLKQMINRRGSPFKEQIDMQENADVQINRVKRIHDACSTYKHVLASKAYREHLPPFYASPKYNLSYCKIGKISSTFWTQFFYILHNDGDAIKKVLTENRQNIHNLENAHQVLGTDKSMCNTTRMLVTTRNPYTRLFSAYIDRMYIPSTSVSIRFDNKCKSQITFPEFLEYVIKNTENGIYDYHWSPVSIYCKPCETNPELVYKQETNKPDVAFIMNQTQLEPNKLDVVHQLIRGAGNWSGFALVDDVFDIIMPTNERHARDCRTWEQAGIRLWEALKIQGFISEKAPFPEKRFRSEEDYKISDNFRSAIADVRERYPMSNEEISQQRVRYFNEFYKTVDPKIIKGIQETFRVDFEMFEYSYDPPPW